MKRLKSEKMMFSGSETVIADVNGTILNITLDELYILCCDDCSKIRVLSQFGMTRLVKMKQESSKDSLLALKSKYGEDIMVSKVFEDIISQGEILRRSDAIRSLIGGNQLGNLEWQALQDDIEVYGDAFVCWVGGTRNSTKRYAWRKVQLDENFGFFVGLFIAEGWYQSYEGIHIKMRDRDMLEKAVKCLYKSTGIYSYIRHDQDEREFFTLMVNHIGLRRLFEEVFSISRYAQNKRLPRTLYSYSDDFKRGLLAGLIDGDGSVNSTGTISIRLSSRVALSQLSYLFKYLGYSCSMMYQDPKPKKGQLIQSSYPLFGIQSKYWGASETLGLCDKLHGVERTLKGKRYVANGEVSTLSLKVVENDKFLKQFQNVYTIETEAGDYIINNIVFGLE